MDETTIHWNDELEPIMTEEELEADIRAGARERGYTYEEYLLILDNGIIGKKEQHEFLAKLRKNK